MIKDYKVVVFTPWGRELTASLLFKYLQRDHKAGIVDEWHLWMNTDPDQEDDRKYGYKLEEENDWIKTFERPPGDVLYPKQMNTGRFYEYTKDTKTIYVRMDDDIVWIEENAIKRLVEHRIDNPWPFVVFPLIWNNAVCSYYLQQGEQMPSWWGRLQTNHCMDRLGWADPLFAESIHRHLLKIIADGDVDKLFMHTSIQLPVGHQFSVSCFAQFGSEYLKYLGDTGGTHGEEEGWHTITMPGATGRPNLIVPNSLISHFSFYHQRNHLLHTDLLDQYKRLADAL